MKLAERHFITDALDFLLEHEHLKTVTRFFPPLTHVRQRVRLTRRKHGSGIHVEIGPPNYRERAYLRLCRRAKARPRALWLHAMKDR